MHIAVLGTGGVGHAFAGAFHKLGHDVIMGARTSDNPKALEWAAASGGRAGSFAEAVDGADAVILAVAGEHAASALGAAGAALDGKVVLDITNWLDFSGGFPPKVVVPEEGSLGAHLQAKFPQAKFVKTLNTMNNAVMVEPGLVPGGHTVFLSGDHEDAKSLARRLLAELGWADDDVLDLGGIETANGPEQFIHLWLRVQMARRDKNIQIRLVTD
ncbi:oxidoreductase [Actinorhabdospora filicis]|uniref:Oxidoreductase n=1 Tax=Actinorhabdospora filicis TaxID=1785913 RepID=A0A9W6SKF6_9ACTN|nr:NAD(P)-binding domain-containing protein [Actinorhabdospora filicis]GLZ77577.1 oxidoreductase [Actinorhabdospora filicis]